MSTIVIDQNCRLLGILEFDLHKPEGQNFHHVNCDLDDNGDFVEPSLRCCGLIMDCVSDKYKIWMIRKPFHGGKLELMSKFWPVSF